MRHAARTSDLPKADAALRPGRWDAPRRTNERQMRRTRFVSRRASVRARPTRTAPRRRDKLEGRPDTVARHEPGSTAARQAMRLGHCAACRTSEASRVQCARGPGPPGRRARSAAGPVYGPEPNREKRSEATGITTGTNVKGASRIADYTDRPGTAREQRSR